MIITAEQIIAAAILARCSDNRDGDSGSVEGQVRRGQQAADRLGWNVAAVHDQDDGYSASRFAKKARKGWAALQEDIRTGRVNAVILRTTSRGSRQMGDWVSFLDLCREHGVLIHVMHDRRTYDTANYRDRKALIDAGSEAEAESDEKSVSIREGVETLMLNGKALAVMPMGYRKLRAENGKATGEAVLNEDAPRVRLLFEMVDQGHTMGEACKATGIYRQQALVLLRKVTYTGKRRMPDGELIDCQWPAIIDEATFYRVQARLAGHKGAGKRPGAYRSLLAHYATCGRCNGEVITEQRYHGQWKKGVKRDPERDPRYRVYKCTKDGCFAIAAEGADKDALYMAAGALMGEGVLEKYLPNDDSLATAQAEVDRLQAELDEWLEADISPRAYKAKEDKYLPQIEAARARAEAARMAASPALRPLTEFAALDFPEIWQRADGAFRALEKMPMAAQRDLLRSVFEIKLYPKRYADEHGLSQVEVSERQQSDGEIAA